MAIGKHFVKIFSKNNSTVPWVKPTTKMALKRGKSHMVTKQNPFQVFN